MTEHKFKITYFNGKSEIFAVSAFNQRFAIEVLYLQITKPYKSLEVL